MAVLRFILVVFVVVANLAFAKHPRRPVIPRIIGGHDVDIDDYPYQVSVLFNGKHGCGGSIINEKFILTAAHCTYEETEENISVRVGSSIINTGGNVIKVAKINQHNKFDYDTMDYDIAVLELENSIEFGDGVEKIDLIEQDQEVNNDDMADATGWGRLSDNGPLATQLQEVTVPIIITTDCQEKYYGAGPDGITDNMFCAGFKDGGKDTCQGDSGGPLVSKGILVGITSWGDVCGQASTPGVYTKLSNFRNYIDDIVNQ